VTLLLTIGTMVVIWCLLTIWVARCAQNVGRSVVWGLGAAAAGILGTACGVMLGARAVDAAASDAVLLAIALPFVGMMIPMVAIGLVVKRSPINITARRTWQVHFLPQGAGSISIDDAHVRIEWPGGAREVSASDSLRAEADGECVRLVLATDVLIAMPMGKPATPAGRRHQSLWLAKRLRVRGDRSG
jgi:hypothetical protein